MASEDDSICSEGAYVEFRAEDASSVYSEGSPAASASPSKLSSYALNTVMALALVGVVIGVFIFSNSRSATAQGAVTQGLVRVQAQSIAGSRRTSTSITLGAVVGLGPAQLSFASSECEADAQGGMKCSVTNPLAAPLGTAHLILYKAPSEHQLILTLSDDNATPGISCFATAVFTGISGTIPTTSSSPLTSNGEVGFAMRWEAGTSTSIILGSINIEDLDVTLHLRDGTCAISTMRVTGSANAHVKSKILPTKDEPLRLSTCSDVSCSKSAGMVESEGTKVTSAIGGGSLTFIQEHSGGAGSLMEVTSGSVPHTTGGSTHYLRAFTSRSATASESKEMMHHIVNMKTGAESMYRVMPVNGTSEKIQHIAGLHPRHAEVLLPHAMLNRMASAVRSQSRRGIGQEILQELCNAYCPACVRNAMNSLWSCSSVVNPGGKCFGCGESCGTEP